MRLKLLGELKDPYELAGEQCLLSVSKKSETATALYYSVLYEHSVFRMTFALASLQSGQDPIQMSHSIVKDCLAKHAEIGLRT